MCLLSPLLILVLQSPLLLVAPCIIVRTPGPDGAVQATVALYGALWARTVHSGPEYSTVVLYGVDLV